MCAKKWFDFVDGKIWFLFGIPDKARIVVRFNKSLVEIVSSFCAKRVQSKFQAEEQWQVKDDFTPNEVASKATRHYIYASLQELKQFVAHLCTLCPRIKGLVAARDNETNTLSIQTDTAYTSSPSFVEKDLKLPLVKSKK